MRTRLLAGLVLAASLVVVSPSPALERSEARLELDRVWTTGTTCTITYYNVCTGWIWILSGFEASDQFGVCFDNCCGRPDGWAHLAVSWHYIHSGAPAGWGFTGTISVSQSDANCCPTGVPLQSTTFLPVAGWNVYHWHAGVQKFVIHATLGPAPGTPLAVATDHPGAVAGGPPACGTCYPTSRINHSFYYGATGACPGSVFFYDGVCDAQLLWDCDHFCDFAVEPRSWGAIKSLYR